MKTITKSSSVLLGVLLLSSMSGVSATAATVTGDATKIDSTGSVIVTEGDDTGGPDTDGKVPDPETDGGVIPSNPDEVDYNGEKGPIKLESVSRLNFGKIKTSTKEIKQNAAALETDKGPRGAMVTFADIRSDVYGYKIQAQLTEPFTSGNNVLNGASISYKNAIAKPEKDNTNTPGRFTAEGAAFTLGSGEDGKSPNAVTVFEADATNKEGKGRYALEFGQSKDYVKLPSTIGTGAADTADKSVELKVPMKTAANMAKGTYQAKVTWSIVTAP